jgi:hypothetical protein
LIVTLAVFEPNPPLSATELDEGVGADEARVHEVVDLADGLTDAWPWSAGR